jgi:ketosteroid isomerase-like protein
MSEANEQIIRDFLAKWETRNAEGMAAAFAEDGVYDNVPDKIRWSAARRSWHS